MKIDGREIATNILDSLRVEVEKLKDQEIIPTLLVILVGDNEQSQAYIKQKEIKAHGIGARTQVLTFDETLSFEKARELVLKLNEDPLIHGIIIQRPAPEALRVDELSDLISPVKEVDGFGDDSLYFVPVAEAVEASIEDAFKKKDIQENFIEWLKKQNIVVMGKGITAGGPIINHLRKLSLNPQIIDSKTQNPKENTTKADILISAVGRDRAVTKDMLKKDVILIGVGLHVDEEGKLRGDFHKDEITDTVSFYSPTPGGIGPINVACLMRNLIKAAKTLTQVS